MAAMVFVVSAFAVLVQGISAQCIGNAFLAEAGSPFGYPNGPAYGAPYGVYGERAVAPTSGGAIAFEGALPTAGAGGINYGCGDGAIGIVSEGIAPAYGPAAHAAGVAPGRFGYGAGMAAPGFAAPSFGYNGFGAVY
ncbi:unnamed protein product [Arctia plantaginis]|uniref:Uncharacterized protein n=1 Tax=Arctia plantaginis TaxID=874455 RepID=A0A8S1AAA8_ARCPL|nr:unnamed protein product [Arctia plantaginis]